MKYAFLFSFYMDRPDDQEDDAGDYGFEAGFLVEGEALKALIPHAEGSLTPEAMHGDLILTSGYSDWFGGVAEDLEGRYNAVHDVSGTWSDDIYVEGFCTYEIETEAKARELMDEWHAAFRERIGENAGLGGVGMISLDKIEPLVPGYTTDAEQVVALLEKLAPRKAGTKPTP